nr:protein prune like [Quercus suber]
MGDTWCQKRSSDLKQYHKNYQRETWNKLLGCLNHKGLNPVHGKVAKLVLKERFKSFNQMFDEIHRTQSSWVVSQPSCTRPPRTETIQPYPREPVLNGLLKGKDLAPIFDFPLHGRIGSQNLSQSTSVIGDGKLHSNMSGKVMGSPSPLEDSASHNNILEPFDFDFQGIFYSQNISRSTSDIGDMRNTKIVSKISEEVMELPWKIRSQMLFSNLLMSSLHLGDGPRLSCQNHLHSQSAATFYNGISPEMEIVESCESINRLNNYLRDRKEASVSGKFLHAVIGQDISNVGLVASTIIYAFYLNETYQSDQLCTVPVINMKRAGLSCRAEIKWLIASCLIDQSSLIFIDEIDLSYYDLFGSLKLVLLNSHKLLIKQEALKEAGVEIFCCRKGESAYPWVETNTIGEDCSCCTLIAERLLLAGIFIETGNLTNPHCNSKDKYMATLLINGAGRFGSNGLYQILKYKMHDVSDLKIVDILHKDFKKWRRLGKPDAAGSRLMALHVGMSSIGISIAQLLAHEDASSQGIKNFQRMVRIHDLQAFN